MSTNRQEMTKTNQFQKQFGVDRIARKQPIFSAQKAAALL
jgi:hypothetical protein